MWFKIVLLLARGVCGRLHYILLLDDYDDNDDECDNGEEPGYPGVCRRVHLYFNDYDDNDDIYIMMKCVSVCNEK